MLLDPIAQTIALAAARQEPNTFLATHLLRTLATQGHWQVEESGVFSSVAYQQEGETHQTPLALVGHSEADKCYIARLHNGYARLAAELARMAGLLHKIAFVTYGEAPVFATIYEAAAAIQQAYPSADYLEKLERLPSH